MSHREIFYYDSCSNLTCVRDDDLGLTYYTYDAGNRMTSVKNPFGEVAYYEYTPGGRMTKRILGNGCVTYYSYDAIGRVSKVDNRKSELSVISSFEYERDPVGNPVSILREDGSVVYYEYDPKHQLTRETQRDSQGQDVYAWEWDYDAAGNRTYQTFNGVTTYYQYNEANELTEETTDGAATYYSYDRCGNTTAKQEPEGTTYYHWDYENLLRQIDLPDGAHNYFTYDADSKRVSKQDSEGFTEFIYQGPDMLKLLLERDEQGQTQAHYTMGNGLESMRREAQSSFYHYDALGSTFELTDAVEDVTDTYLCNAWGEILARTGSTLNPHTYVGKERYYLTPDAVFCLLGLRYYAPRVGRFVTLDPQRDDLNRYAYVGAVPTTYLDARGLKRVMLTFDDGPKPASTLKIIRKLRAAGNVKAGFFVIGRWVRNWPSLVRQMGGHGHRVGNHTDTHPRPVKGGKAHWCHNTSREMMCEWYFCHKSVWHATGWVMSLYRTPGLGGGDCRSKTDQSVSRAERLLTRNSIPVKRYSPEVMGEWTLDYDWKHEAIKRFFDGKAKPGDSGKWLEDARPKLMDAVNRGGDPVILIFHEHGQYQRVGTADILEHVIQALRNDGHTIVNFKP